jgi:mannosyltransferase
VTGGPPVAEPPRGTSLPGVHPSPAAARPPTISAAGEPRWPVLALVALGFGLRVFRLGTQSLWGDEAFSVFRAKESLVAITEAVPREGTLPPLYYYLLHFWQPLAGTSETSVRFLSVLFGVLALPLLYLLVRRGLGWPTALVATAVATVSPFWIYYSQETRTYAQVTALLILALYLLLRAGQDPARPGSVGAWAAYALAAAAAMASYYFAGFALAVAVLWLLADRRAWPGLAWRCLLAQAATLALLLPLLVYTFSGLVGAAGSVDRGGIPLATIVAHLTVVFNFGTSLPAAPARPFVGLALALGALGLLALRWRAAALWGALVVGPVLAI